MYYYYKVNAPGSGTSAPPVYVPLPNPIPMPASAPMTIPVFGW